MGFPYAYGYLLLWNNVWTGYTMYLDRFEKLFIPMEYFWVPLWLPLSIYLSPSTSFSPSLFPPLSPCHFTTTYFSLKIIDFAIVIAYYEYSQPLRTTWFKYIMVALRRRRDDRGHANMEVVLSDGEGMTVAMPTWRWRVGRHEYHTILGSSGGDKKEDRGLLAHPRGRNWAPLKIIVEGFRTNRYLLIVREWLSFI